MKAWCIKRPDGTFLATSIHKERKLCRQQFVMCLWSATGGWSGLYKQGYRCVKVVIKEVSK